MAIPSRKWNPIHLSCTQPNLAHPFFTDDLVIFSKADLKHSGLLKSFLSNFCELFGHRVNTNKTDVFFSDGVKDDIRRNINNTLSFQEVKDLGLYLEAPLFHQRVTKTPWIF